MIKRLLARLFPPRCGCPNMRDFVCPDCGRDMEHEAP